MGDVRIRYGWTWIVFIVVMVIGAGLMTSDDPTRVRIGIGMLVAPLVLTFGLLTVFYLLSRRQD